MFFFQEAGHPHDRGALRNNSAQEIFSDPQLSIFPADLHLGVGETHMTSGLVPEEIRSSGWSAAPNLSLGGYCVSPA
jgi:hypothetical protein